PRQRSREDRRQEHEVHEPDRHPAEPQGLAHEHEVDVRERADECEQDQEPDAETRPQWRVAHMLRPERERRTQGRRTGRHRSGATASNAVGIESKVRLTRIPRRRSMRLLKNATASPATAMPMVLALTAKPMAAGVTLYALASDGRIAWVAKRSTTVRKAVRP